jgi:hypothetical protein
MPEDPRGLQLINIRKVAEAKAAEIEKDFKNLASAVNTDSVKASCRTTAQQKALERIHRRNAQLEVVDEYDEQNEGENGEGFKAFNKENVVVDIRTVLPSSIAMHKIDNNYARADYQTIELADRIALAEKERVDKRE